MKSFNISDIKIKQDPKNQPSLERKLTDEVITPLDPASGVLPNAELEGGEYLRFPDGLIQKTAGNKHTKGGMKMNIPDGVEILSAKSKLTKDQVSRLNDEFDLKLTTNDTYATAQQKYDTSIGLTKLYDEQEQLFQELGRQQKKELSEGTQRINNEYLSKKISNNEKQKKGLEEDRNTFFSRVFSFQEVEKSLRGKENKEGSFALGGLSMQNWKALCKKHGLDPETAKGLLAGKLPKYEKGGGKGDDIKRWKEELKQYDPEGKYKTAEDAKKAFEAGDLSSDDYDMIENLFHNIENAQTSSGGSGTYTPSYGDNRFSKEEREYQHRSDGAYGKITKENLPQVMEDLYKNFPDIVSDTEVFGVTRNEDGTFSYNEIDYNKALPQVLKFQERAQKRMEASADVVINNPEKFSEEQVEAAKKFKESETFKKGAKAREFDSKLGQFTSGRTNLGIDVVTPEEQKALADKGIYTVRQLEDALKDDPNIISEGSKQRFDDISSMMGDDADFTINPYEVQEEEEKKPPVDPGKEITDDIKPPVSGLPAWYHIPEQRPMPPTPMDAHLKQQARLGRIDPIRIGIEPQIQQSGERMKFVAEQAADLPDSQRFAVLANAQVSEAKSLNSAITQANMWNAQQQQQAKLFNIGQSDRETLLNQNFNLNFEARQLKSKANTEEEYKRYFEELKRQRAHDYYTRQNLAMIDEMTPDYSFTGMGWAYDPEGEWKARRNNYRELQEEGYIDEVT